MKKLIFILLFSFCTAQSQNLNIAFKSNYTTTSRLYPDLSKYTQSSFDPYTAIDGIIGYGIDIRNRIFEDKIQVGLSSEYIYGTTSTASPISSLSYTDGYSIYLFELNGYLTIPFSTEKFRMYLGGGINSGFGYRIKKIADISVENSENPLSFGIQVLTGMEYLFFNKMSLRMEMKFRDPEIETSSYFDKNLIYNNITYQLPKQTIKSRINIDGIVFDFSLVYYL